MAKIFYWLIHNIFRIYKCNNYPVSECGYEERGYKIKTWHKGKNFIVPACPKCKSGILL